MSNPESPLVEGEQHATSKGCFEETEMTHMLPLKGTETQSAFYRHWPVTGRSKNLPSGPKRKELCFLVGAKYFTQNSPASSSPTPWFSSSLRASRRSHSTPRLTSRIQSCSKSSVPQGPSDPDVLSIHRAHPQPHLDPTHNLPEF